MNGRLGPRNDPNPEAGSVPQAEPRPDGGSAPPAPDLRKVTGPVTAPPVDGSSLAVTGPNAAHIGQLGASGSRPVAGPPGVTGSIPVPRDLPAPTFSSTRGGVASGASLPPARATVLGKYEIFASLGRGGMAQVFLALKRSPLGINKLVVVKMLRADDATSPEMVEMFLDEARLAARINHPNVVATYDVGREDRTLFIAMEYLEGQSLFRIQSAIRAGAPPLPPAYAARIVSDALAGLHHAHEQRDFDGRALGVVHRDVSPQNIFVTYDGCIKILDFGIAKAASSQETQAEVFKGKIGYMAPEHALGVPVDRRADVFAAGIVLWELLAGRSLMSEGNAVASLMKLLNEPIPPLSAFDPGIDPRLEVIVARALARQTASRFQTALEMRIELDDYITAVSPPLRDDAIANWMRAAFATERAAEAQRNAAVMSASPARGTASPPAPSLVTGPRTRTAPPRDRRRAMVVSLFAAGALLGGAALAIVSSPRLLHGREPALPVAVTPAPQGAPLTSSIAPSVALSPTEAPLLPGAATPTDAVRAPSPPPVRTPPPAVAARSARHHRAPATPKPRQTSGVTNAAAPAGSGFLTLDTYPWTRVTLKGKVVGTTPVVKLQLPAGTHAFVLDNPDQGVHQTVSITISRGQHVTKRLAYK